MSRTVLDLSPNVWAKTPPWPKKRSVSNDVRRPTRRKAAVSQHHLGGTGTLDAVGPYFGWPLQPTKEQELERNHYAILVATY